MGVGISWSNHPTWDLFFRWSFTESTNFWPPFGRRFLLHFFLSHRKAANPSIYITKLTPYPESGARFSKAPSVLSYLQANPSYLSSTPFIPVRSNHLHDARSIQRWRRCNVCWSAMPVLETVLPVKLRRHQRVGFSRAEMGLGGKRFMPIGFMYGKIYLHLANIYRKCR